MDKKNLTVSMDEETARWTRIAAAEAEVSMSRFVGMVLRERMVEDVAYDRALQAFSAVTPTAGSAGRGLPSREDVHDRAQLRR